MRYLPLRGDGSAGYVWNPIVRIDYCIALQQLLMRASPRIPGHEVIGHVVAIGPHEKEWKLGDRVGGAWHGGHDG